MNNKLRLSLWLHGVWRLRTLQKKYIACSAIGAIFLPTESHKERILLFQRVQKIVCKTQSCMFAKHYLHENEVKEEVLPRSLLLCITLKFRFYLQCTRFFNHWIHRTAWTQQYPNAFINELIVSKRIKLKKINPQVRIQKFQGGWG